MEEGLPVGTSIIMTERSEERSTTDFWYYKVQEKVSRIDLNKFTRMSGDGKKRGWIIFSRWDE